MIVDNTIHDKKFDLRLRGAGGRPLRQASRIRYKNIYHQEDGNDLEVEGRVDFKFFWSYKDASWPPMHPKESRVKMMSRTRARFAKEPYLT